MQNRKLLFSLVVIGLAVTGFSGYRYFFPKGPITDPVENPIRNQAVKDWTAEESKVSENPLKEVYWGDLHVHTRYSFDAYLGGTRLSPDDAYRFARGEEVEWILGRKVHITRPLDFAAVTDHS